MAPQINTDRGNFTLDFKHLGLCASPIPLQTLGPCPGPVWTTEPQTRTHVQDPSGPLSHRPGPMSRTRLLIGCEYCSPNPTQDNIPHHRGVFRPVSRGLYSHIVATGDFNVRKTGNDRGGNTGHKPEPIPEATPRISHRISGTVTQRILHYSLMKSLSLFSKFSKNKKI